MTQHKADKATGTQAKKFEQAAREVEADEDEEAFKRRLRQVAKAGPPHGPSEPKKKPAK